MHGTTSLKFNARYFTLGTDRLSRNAGEYQSALRKTPEEPSFELAGWGHLWRVVRTEFRENRLVGFEFGTLFHYFCLSSRVSDALNIGYFIIPLFP